MEEIRRFDEKQADIAAKARFMRSSERIVAASNLNRPGEAAGTGTSLAVIWAKEI